MVRWDGAVSGTKRRKTLQWKSRLLVVHAGHVLDEAQNLVGVAHLVVVPADDLDEGVGQGDAGLGIEDGGVGVAQEVGGHNGLVGVGQDALQLVLAGLLHGGADLIVGGGLAQVDGQVHHGHIQGGNAHGHTRQLAVQAGNDFAHGLGSAGGAGDDIAGGGAATAPVLQGRAVHGLLRGGDGVHGGHQAVLDAETVVQDLGDGGEAVRRAGRVGNDFVFAGQLVVVDAVNDRQIGAFGRSGLQNAFRAGFQMDFRFFGVREDARAFVHDVDVHFFPGQVVRIAFSQDFHGFAVDGDRIGSGGNLTGFFRFS